MKFIKALLRDAETQIDDRLHEELGLDNIAEYTVCQKVFPAYRFVDVYRAIDVKMSAQERLRSFDSENHEDLSDLIHGEEPHWASRQINRSARTAWATGSDEEVFLPTDSYWIFDAQKEFVPRTTVIRLRYKKHDEATVIEVASASEEFSAVLVKEISEQSIVDSIYRQQMLALSYESGTKDEYGDVEKPERLRINFRTAPPVSRDEFVVDDEVFGVLKRNVIDLHLERDRLKTLGVPVRRGVLLHGPPGTGKTYACRYVCGSLQQTTRILVAGTALNKVSQIFDLARVYQPSVVILEDVDLVFSARDISLYSSALGDLLDQMDGLRPFEDVSVILTTNSLERMEAAIKDRPGRISQCIYFGAPGKRLRAKYIEQYAKAYDYSKADHDELVRMSEGTTPAFIKEWVHRTVQFACERTPENSTAIELETADFKAAHDEMRRYTDNSSGRIIGFLGNG